MAKIEISINKWESELSLEENKEYRRILKLPVTKQLVYYARNKRFEVVDYCVEKYRDEFSSVLIKVPYDEIMGEPSTYQWFDDNSEYMIVRIMNAYLVEMQQSNFLYNDDDECEGTNPWCSKRSSDFKDESQNDYGCLGYKSKIAFPTDYVVIDIETNGKDRFINPGEEKIIELGAIKFENDVEVDRFETLINPGVDIYPPTTKLTGITNEMLKDAKSICEVIEDFISFIGDAYIVGYNIQSFDKTRINKVCVDYLEFEFDNPTVDLKVYADKFFKKGENIKKVSVETVAEYFDISTDGEHRALQDCWIENQIYEALKNVIISEYGSYKKFARECERHTTLKLLPPKK